MIALESVVHAKTIPSAPLGWFEYGYTALSDGRLVLIRTRKDVHTEQMRWSQGEQSLYPRDIWDGDMRLSIFDGDSETDIVTMPSGVAPVVDRMADGRWIVAARLAANNERNGRIYAADGRKEHEICLGDGIDNLLCSPDGTIWVGYSDEGIFKGAQTDGRWPVSTGGIVQFDASGAPIWSFNDQARDGYAVSDACAMTLSGNDLWACFYSDFPIARICNGQSEFWPNSVYGAEAIAVADGMVVLGGGYRTDADCITLVKLEAKASHKLGTMRYPLAGQNTASLLQGRGDTLHIVSDGLWFKVGVETIVGAVNQRSHP